MGTETERQIIMILNMQLAELRQIRQLLSGVKDEGLHVRTQESKA